MADGMNQKTEDRGQKTDACVPLCGTFIRGAATPQQFVRVSLFCLLSSVLCPLNAEELPDPTRPPASILVPSAAGGAELAPVPAGLQSILISKTRRIAIIDGETVELGGKHGDAKLIEVNEGSVVLRGAQGRQEMTLFPDVKMTPAKPPIENIDSKVKTKPQSPVGRAATGGKK